jgi:glutamine amidotransferase
MGWNELAVRDAMCKTDDGGLFRHLGDNPFVYFIHSFYVPLCEHTIGVTDYIHPFSAALHKNNFYATQFHPEKSGKVGEQILSNFLQINA